MKRIIGLVIAFVICLSMITVADPIEIDLSSMTLDELVTLKTDVMNEISSRIGGEDMIYAGKYLVGTDIKSGQYTITNTADGYLTIYLWDSVESYKKHEADWGDLDGRLSVSECSNGETLMISLQDGYYMDINRGEGICKAAKPSWAP